MGADKMRAFLAFLCLWVAVTEAGYVKYKDPKQPLNARIKDLMNRMTLEEKIGQMTQIERKVASPDVMKQFFIGSVLSGGGSVPAPKASAADWVNMVNDIQKGSLSTRLGIPMIYGIDAVHGHNNVYKATIFPHNVGLGVTRDPELLKRIGAATALEVRATGIPYAFAPCIAVCRDPRWGRCYESYSEDHKIVQSMTEIIPGLQGDLPANSNKGVPFVAGKTKVAACAKHFVGDGGTVRGIDENNTIIDYKGLLNIHMPAYFDSVKKGVATVMVSYSSWNGNKMHSNRDLVTGFLKGKLKFRGFVISDWQGIDRITNPPHMNYSYSVQAGVLAGIDMIMVPENFQEFINSLTLLVKNKVIPMSRIDDAVRRILRVKFVMGLFENPLSDLSLANQLGSQEHRELAREAVRKSLVLLKNGKVAKYPLLPLPKKAPKILVAGTHADNLGYQCGGWTIEWQGVQGNDLTAGTTILAAIKKTVDPSTQVVYSENPDENFVKNSGFSHAIVVVGEVPYAEMFGDSTNLSIADPGPSTIKNVCGAMKCVVVVVSGRPVVLEPYVAQIDAVVAAWLPGSEGQGVADVLFGDYGFSGKLARTWFKSVDQLPMNVGDAHYDPLYPFGFGITTQPRHG
ncbi:Glycosyl hydrolase family protein [Perilla frutescens var. hirtella]|uniref:beta-glucosidase n=1 Tax=Perilla frutescens var. hirtella TaxID=608512 RepID=A0AAD4J4B4_PERFH|nr:Glycosyl hydrolase family protein [Perilla frutescens var. hirtella]